MPRLILACSAIALLATGCVDDFVPDLDTAPVVDALDDIVERSGVTETDQPIELETCPVRDVGELIDASLELADGEAVSGALDGGDQRSAVTFVPGTNVPYVACHRVGTDGTARITVTAAPADIDLFAAAFAEAADRDNVGTVSVDVDESRPYHGGRFQHICVEYPDAPEANYCEVDWADENVLIGITVVGRDALDIRTDAIEERYRLVVPLIVQRLSDDT